MRKRNGPLGFIPAGLFIFFELIFQKQSAKVKNPRERRLHFKMVTFRMAEHSVTPGGKLIEIWDDGNFIGSIYPTDRGIHVVSKNIAQRPCQSN